jgi:hypothetical protein
VVLRSNTNRSNGGIDPLFTSDHEPCSRPCYGHHRARAKRRHPYMPNMPSVRAMITRQKSLASLGRMALDAGAFGISVITGNSQVGCR